MTYIFSKQPRGHHLDYVPIRPDGIKERGLRFALMRFVDQHFGAWLCRSLALFLWICGKHLKRLDHPAPPAPDSVREILVMKFLGLGSILQATPLLQALRRRYPQARLTLLTFRANRALADLGIGVDTVVTVDTSSFRRFLTSNLAALGRLWQTRFDVVINLEFFATYSVLLTALLRKRFAMAFGGFATYRNRFFHDFVSYDSAQHVQQKFLNFARRLGYDGPSPPLARLRVNQPASIVAEIEQREGVTLQANDYCVLVNINSGEMAPRRRWPAEHFRTVVEELLLRPRVRCVFIGGPQDRQTVVRFQTGLSEPGRVVNLAGRTSLQELVALMQLADLYLGNDSGPLHLATCTGLPVLALFGPESPAVYGPPPAPRNTVLYRAEPCGPCLSVYTDKQTRCGDNICLKRIHPAEVLGVLKERYLRESPTDSANRRSLPLVPEPFALSGVS
jgi:ADP-heptose:LPS heptosyltransferase